jgi:hypothetical protein
MRATSLRHSSSSRLRVRPRTIEQRQSIKKKRKKRFKRNEKTNIQIENELEEDTQNHEIEHETKQSEDIPACSTNVSTVSIDIGDKNESPIVSSPSKLSPANKPIRSQRYPPYRIPAAPPSLNQICERMEKQYQQQLKLNPPKPLKMIKSKSTTNNSSQPIESNTSLIHEQLQIINEPYAKSLFGYEWKIVSKLITSIYEMCTEQMLTVTNHHIYLFLLIYWIELRIIFVYFVYFVVYDFCLFLFRMNI